MKIPIHTFTPRHSISLRPSESAKCHWPNGRLDGSSVAIQHAPVPLMDCEAMRRQAAVSLMAAALWCAGPCASAREIHVSLGDNARPTLNGPAGGAGTIWNSWSPLKNVLKDALGNDTGVTFTAAGEGPYGDWWCDLELLTGGVFDRGGGSLPFVISGLDPTKTYNLHIASGYGQNGGNTVFNSSNKMDTPSPQTADNRSARNGTTWLRGVNCVLFQNIEPDASGRISLTYGGVGTYGMLNGFQVVESGLAAVTFSSWADSPAQGLTAGTNGGALDDPDLDGIVNLLEFALGGAPMVFSRAILPTLTCGDDGWVFEYDRSDLSRPPATTQMVEYSGDLVHWSAVSIPSISNGNVAITDGGASDHVKITIPALGGNGFARLKVTR